MEPMARTRSPIGRHVIALLLVIIGAGAVHKASAQTLAPVCTLTGVYGDVKDDGVPSRLVVPVDAPVGTVLFTREYTWPASGTVVTSSCRGVSRVFVIFNVSPQPVPGISPDTLPYGQPGSGLGIRWRINGQLANVRYNTPQGVSVVGLYWNQYSNFFSPAETWTLEIVKTDMVPTNPAKSLTISVDEGYFGLPPPWWPSNPGAVYEHTFRRIGNGPGGGKPVEVVWPSGPCDVATDNLTIQMGDWDADQLDKSFATPLSAPQNIVLNCPANPGAVLTFSGAVIPGSQAPNTFALTPGGNTAGNVGVQFFINNNPNVAIRTDTKYAVGSSTTAGTVNIPIQARYIKTGTPTPGRANSTITATFTFN